MAIKFDLTSAPPTLADIAAEREQAAQDRVTLEKKNKRFTVIAIATGLSLLCFQLFVAVPAVHDDSPNPTLVSILALYTPYVIGTFFFTGLTLHNKLIERPRKMLRTTLAVLEEVPPEEILGVIGTGQQHVEITAYQEKVAAQGRSLVRAELDAMQRWLNARRPAE